MKTSKRILLVLVFVMFLLGACLSGAGIALGGTLHDGFGYFHNFSFGRYTGEEYKENVDIEAFSNLDMDIALGDIEIREGSAFALEIQNIPEDEYSISTQEDTLIIKIKGSNWGINFDFHTLDYKITLTIPKGTELEDVVLHSRMGDIDMDGITMEYISITQNMGDVDLQSIIVNGDSDLSNDMGDIKFSGESLGNMKADDKMGDIKLKIEGAKKEYSYELSTSMGDIKVDGDHENDGMNEHVSGGAEDAPYHIEADNSMGDIKVEFAR